MRVLVDTSVWVAHLRTSDPRLLRLVEADDVLCHPYVVTELACGSPPRREALIDVLSAFESTPVAAQEELRRFIQQRRLCGRGCGLVDLALLASVSMAEGVGLWTLDKRLRTLARELGRDAAP